MNILLQNEFYSEIKTLIEQSRSRVYESVNAAMIETYWQIGKLIVGEEKNGKDQTDYSTFLIDNLEKQLTRDFGKGFDGNNLICMRRFFIAFPIVNTLRPSLSWSHYLLIINLEEEQVQIFYMNKAADNRWSVQQLAQQIESQSYQRTLSIITQEQEKQDLPKEELQYKPSDLIEDSKVRDFLDCKPNPVNLEQGLEQAVLDRIQDFLLELANGFCFVARQKNIITEENKHYHIDLVFYNYLLRCFVLINLRFGVLKDEDVQMMEHYVRMYDNKYRPKDDNPTFGILIWSHNDETELKYTSLEDRKQIFTTLYELVIPSKEEFTEIVNDEIQRRINEN